MDSCIYVCGGRLGTCDPDGDLTHSNQSYDDDLILDSAECFDARSGCWHGQESIHESFMSGCSCFRDLSRVVACMISADSPRQDESEGGCRSFDPC